MKDDEKTKFIRKLWHVRTVRHLCYWLLAYAVLFVTVLVYERASSALEITTIIVIPGPIPVYLNFIALSGLFEKRRYTLYFITLVVIVAGSGFLIEYVFNLIMQDPGSHISGPGLALFYIAVTTGLNYYAQGLRQQFRLQEAEVERTRAELSLLKAQVNPHFFFNTLNSLYALSLDRSERVPEVILKLSALMRYVLEGSNREETALEDELSFIEDYVELEKLRISGNPDIRVEKKGDLSGKLIAPMILVPFVENGFKHGINTMVGDGYLLIRLKVEEGNLEFVVKNSRTAGKPDSTGMGLKNVKRRLELLYPGSHDLSIHERDDWFEIGLRIKP